MGLPTVTQTWTISPNNRYVFATVIGATGAVMYSWTQFLLTTMGWTCKGSCDGTTGAMDGVNRITAANKWATRNNGAAGAMSWIVVTDGQGINWCYSFNSASDDIVRLAHSTGGNYVAAATPTQQPTATDECFDATSGSWVSATASSDRVWHMWGNSDKKMARLSINRAGAPVSFIKTEKFTSSLVSPATFSLGTGGGTVGAIKSFYNAGEPAGGFQSGSGITQQYVTFCNYIANSKGDLCRVHCGGADNNIKASQAGESVAAAAASPTYFTNEKPYLQGGTGELLFPHNLGSLTLPTTGDGKLGNVIDSWFAWTNANTTPSPGDSFGNLQFLALGSGIILPWDGATTAVFV